MPSNENPKSQIKSRQRVADHGEVFTNPREVNAMLDLVRDESFRLDSRFLEPSCGDGNFLIEILRRKLSLLLDIKSQTDWEFKSLIAVGSCYGIDILPDNAEACRKRLEEFKQHMDDFVESTHNHSTGCVEHTPVVPRKCSIEDALRRSMTIDQFTSKLYAMVEEFYDAKA